MGRDRSVPPLVSTGTRKTDDSDPSRVSDLTLMRTDVANCGDEWEKERMIEGNSNIYIYLSSMDLRSFFFDLQRIWKTGRVEAIFPVFF